MQEQIIEMFNQIAPSYDKANKILSFGVDKTWRIKGVKNVLENTTQTSLDILDIACGTGDMIKIWQKYSPQFGKTLHSIKGIDASFAMLEIARRKIANVEFIEAQAQNLPINDESTDIISISYGIRNVVQRQKAFEEFFRVLKNGELLGTTPTTSSV